LAFAINWRLPLPIDAGIGVIIDNNLSRQVQSGSTGCADKTGSYTILPVKTVAVVVKNL
jgi:hypothetical protein